MTLLPPTPPVPPQAAEPPARPLFERGALAWLIAVDALWTLPEVGALVAAPLLAPICFILTAAPIWRIQRREGDTRTRACAKAALCGVLAALPFPVCGTAFGAAMLALAARR